MEKCKKCKQQPPRRGQPPCSSCRGSGWVEIERDPKTGEIISVKPAVKS